MIFFKSIFTRFPNFHKNYTTKPSWRMRQSLPKVKLNYVRTTFIFSGAKIFIELPLNIANAESI